MQRANIAEATICFCATQGLELEVEQSLFWGTGAWMAWARNVVSNSSPPVPFSHMFFFLEMNYHVM
jgi:hypothetical protein